ncbi:MAG: hypothetical protein Q4G23_04245 [Clostridia bacterium]|nr:hypothetical protein [Clostridia bacterium]
MSKIKIGWSEKSIIPEGAKVSLAGQFYERVSDVVETPLTVTAFCVDNGEDSFVICSCDLVSTSHQLLESVRAIVKEKTDISAEKIIVGAIHTHTAPAYARRSDTFGGGLRFLERFKPENVKYEELAKTDADDIFRDEEAHAYIAGRIAEAVIEAWNGRSEGLYAEAFGRAAVGMCRRVCYDDGSAKMWGDTNKANFTELEGGNDSGIEILFTYDKDKKLTGVVANVACPAQVLEHRNFISSDYWGKVKEYLRAEYGEDIYVLGLISAAGDQCPRDMIRWVEPETPINDPNIERDYVIERTADPSMFDLSGCKKVARRISDEIKYAFEEVTSYVSEAELIHKTFKLDMPVRRVTIEEKDKAEEVIKNFFDKNCSGTINFRDTARLHIYAGTLARYEDQQTKNIDEIEVHIIRLGTIAFATNPYELFLDYGNQMRARSKAKQTFLIQLCCGSKGYLPTEKAESGSHYSAYVSSGVSGHVGGDLLVRKTVSEINKMFE